MRWFKHMTNSWDDEKVSEIVDAGGLELYGLYFRILEIVASQTSDTSQPVCNYSLKRWARLCNLLANKFERLVKVLAKSRLITISQHEQLLKVEIPNIRKYRDEYSEKREKRQRKNRDNIPTVSEKSPRRTEADTETETDTEAEEKPQKMPELYNSLLTALGKLQLTAEEYEIGKKLINSNCTIADVEAARIEKGKNNLKYLQNIVCEMRDKRLKSEEYDDNPFLQPGYKFD